MSVESHCDGISCEFEYDPERGERVCTYCERFEDTGNHECEDSNIKTCLECGCQFKFIPRFNLLKELCYDCVQAEEEFYEQFCGYEI